MYVPVVCLGAALSGSGLLTACSAAVSGAPVPVGGTVSGHVATQLSTLLPDPATFPPTYQAIPLTGPALSAAAADLTGVPSGARVRPAGCAPSAPPAAADSTAMMVGTDSGARATVTVELTRTRQSFAEVRDELDRCGELAVSRNGADSTVRSDVLSSAGDDSIDVARTVESHGAHVDLRQSMTARMGQAADVRVTVTYMTFGTTAPDLAAVSELFDATLARVRAAG
ncbi:sensor domain-containing protein [Skermania piniformis]|uniref:Sensor domain-containing protein n=1 Tax=Skermania pinensis TaxID=39122 RepID=A0ABX8SE41_9ACTN|nr:sensor domain-containing protein [Skermania piniformis]QXQ15182.1 sensor domain-containing protein [Skermania piniformis]